MRSLDIQNDCRKEQFLDGLLCSRLCGKDSKVSRPTDDIGDVKVNV